MMNTVLDLEILDLGNGKNPFDELMSQMERMNLQGILDVDKGDLEKTILFLERKFQDFAESDIDKSKVILQAINANLLLYENSKTNSFITIHSNLKKLKHISMELDHTDHLKSDDFLISSYLTQQDLSRGEIDITSIQEAFNSVFQVNMEYNSNESLDEWIIELNFETDLKDRHKPLEFIHTFIQGMNTIEGVSVILEDIKVGSIKAKLKILFDDITSKDEVKELLESTKMFAKGKLEREYKESELFDSEAKKNQIEAELLKESLEALKSDSHREQQSLERKSLEYDIERKRLENEEKKLELFKKRKNILQELLADGIIEQKQFQMLINGLPFLKIENGNLTIGENIDVIDDL